MKNLKIFLLIIISMHTHVYGNYNPDHNDISLNKNLLFQTILKADAGPDETITLPNSSVSLRGSVERSIGEDVAYEWTQVSGPVNAFIISSKKRRATVILLKEGVYTFQLMVSSSQQGSDTDTVNITVKPAENLPPIANAGADQTITLPKNDAVLNGSGRDSDGSIVGYRWTQLDGPVMNAQIVNPTQPTTQVVRLQAEGVYTFQLTVTDDKKASRTGTTNIQVEPAQNSPPIANAGADQSITLPKNDAVLDGSGTDADGQITSFRWTKITGPSQFSIESPTQAQTQIRNLAEGNYRFRLTVTDNDNDTDSAFVNVTVQKALPPNSPPIANAGVDQIIVLPKNDVVLKGSGTDADGQITSFQWIKISGPSQFSIESATQAQTRIRSLAEGNYRFRLTVTDNDNDTDNAFVNITVQKVLPPNKPPIANAGEDQVIALPKNDALLSGSGTDADGQIISFQWTKISGPSQLTIESPTKGQTQIRNLEEGDYRFRLTVTDNDNATDSAIVNVTVQKALPLISPPIANAGEDQSITLPISRVRLRGSGNSANGTIEVYQWTQLDGPILTAEIVNPTQPSTQVVFLNKEGDYRFQLKVTDYKQDSATDTVNIRVKPDTNDSKADAGADQTITLPTSSVRLQGGGNIKDEENISFRWSQIEGPSQSNIVSPTQAQTQIRDLVEGVYQFEFSVSDNKGASETDRVLINVNPETLASINWFIFGGLGLVVLGTTLYYIFWIPIPKKILVYFMHKDEEELVRKLMPDGRKTESYSIGRCTRGKIKKMKKKGLVVYVLNTTKLHINTPGQTRSINYSIKKGKTKFEGIELLSKPVIKLDNVVRDKTQSDLKREAIDFPTFYIITLDEPLLPVYEKKLESIGVEIIQHVPDNNYIVLIDDADQLKLLHGKEFEFIRHDQHYTAYDRGLIIREEHRKKAAELGENIFLDLILHREEDLLKVSKFIKDLDIKIIQSYRNRIRISSPAQFVKDFKLSDNKFIQAIYEYIPAKLHNDIARRLIGIDTDVSGKSYISETGEGEIIAVADTGIDSDHPDLKSQIIDAVSWGRKSTNDTSDSHGHGTHVTGSIVGDGTASNGKIKGMAPGAKVFFQSIMDDDESLASFDMQLNEILKQAYQKGARIHNNSWGSSAESRYTFDSTTIDEFVYNNPEMLIVISVGNEGTYNSMMDSEKGYIGFGSVCSPATNKNGLTVGATRSERKEGGYSTSLYGAIWPEKFPFPPTSTETISGDPKELAAFSSRGRCDDGRMKPDIVAPGTDILSTQSKQAPLRHFHGGFAAYNDAYAFLGGTSMATPIVSGAAAIVREYYKKQKKCSILSAALVKATLINGTVKLDSKSALHMGDSIPNPNQGYGMLDLTMTIPNDKNQFQLVFTDSLQDPSVILNMAGSQYTMKFQLKQKAWIRVCLAYTDYPARSIQNDLDLIIDHDQTREKWSGNIGINAHDIYRNGNEDRTNNMETIRIDQAKPGLYTIKVIAHNLPMKERGQGFALVLTTSDMSAHIEK